jgi:hypothetical protein
MRVSVLPKRVHHVGGRRRERTEDILRRGARSASALQSAQSARRANPLIFQASHCKENCSPATLIVHAPLWAVHQAGGSRPSLISNVMRRIRRTAFSRSDTD